MHAEHIGIDWDGPLCCELDSTVQVDPVDIPGSQNSYDELCVQISPLLESADYGIDIYNKTLLFLLNH